MIFTEALDSYKPFRRSGWQHWLEATGNKLRWSHGGDATPDFQISWLRQIDWEIQEVEVYITITRRQLVAAIEASYPINTFDYPERVCEKLGLP